LPDCFTLASAGFHTKVASMSPRSQAAAISGGRMFSTVADFGSTPASFNAKRSW
jgi:hypothetical protein